MNDVSKKCTVCRCENCAQKRRKMIKEALEKNEKASDDDETVTNMLLQQPIVPRRVVRASESRDSLLAHLKVHNLEPVPMPGDGNCQFRAIAAYYTGTNHLKVRQDIVEYIWKNRDKFEADIVLGLGYPSVVEYCRQMLQPGTWGDATTLSAFCMLRNVNIVVFSDRGMSQLYPDRPEDLTNPHYIERRRLGLIRFNDHYEATRVVSNA